MIRPLGSVVDSNAQSAWHVVRHGDLALLCCVVSVSSVLLRAVSHLHFTMWWTLPRELSLGFSQAQF
jgi:hypothetical protein